MRPFLRASLADARASRLLKNPLTTSEIKACVEDLKVLGKKDFKMLLKYRAAIREDVRHAISRLTLLSAALTHAHDCDAAQLGLDVKVDEKEEVTETVEVQPLDEEEQITQEVCTIPPRTPPMSSLTLTRTQLERLAREEALKKRRDRRRVNEKKQREVQRMQLNMVTPMDIGLERQDGVDDADMFDLGEVEGGKERRGVNGELGSDADEVLSEEDEEEVARKRRRRLPLNPIPEAALAAQNAEDDDEDVSDTERRTRRLEESLDILYDSYQQSKLERDAKHKVKEQRRKKALAEGGEFKGLDDEAQDSDEESEESDGIDSDPAPQPSDDEDSSDEEDEPVAPTASTSKAGLITSLKQNKVLSTSAQSRQAAMWFDQPAFKGLPGGGLEALLGGSGSDDEDDEMDGDEEDASEEDEGVRTVWDEMGEGSDEEEEEDEESDEESDDDFRGAREEFVEDEDMEDEADIDAQEQAEVEKAQRIASTFAIASFRFALSLIAFLPQSSA